jgi:murein DD-endopeptidase MepM/ murein hydrolase activator NlpD
VRILQYLLNLLGYKSGYVEEFGEELELSGRFDTWTSEAVHKFKETHLPGGNRGAMAGVVGPTTWETLLGMATEKVPGIRDELIYLGLDPWPMGKPKPAAGSVIPDASQASPDESSSASLPPPPPGGLPDEILRRLARAIQTNGWPAGEILAEYSGNLSVEEIASELRNNPIYPGGAYNAAHAALAQARLRELQYFGKCGNPLLVDGAFGENSLFSTNNFKYKSGLLNLVPEDERETFPGKKYTLSSMDYAGFLGSDTWRALFSESATVNDWLPNSGVRDETKLAQNLANLGKNYSKDSEEFYRACNDVIYSSKSGIYPLASEAGNWYNFFQVRKDRDPYRFHKGNDMWVGKGTPIYSTYYGEVKSIDSGGGGGNRLVIRVRFQDAPEEKTYLITYMHMRDLPALIKGAKFMTAKELESVRATPLAEDMLIEPGDRIGLVGDTGLDNDAFHLHEEIQVEGGDIVCVYPFIPIDPFHPFYPANP